ncbi:MAG: hypothetical protein AAGC67_00460 [Myxococcota bacterium]
MQLNPDLRSRLLSACALLLLSLVGAPLASVAHEQSYGFAWASQSSSPSYEVGNTVFAYNDAGGDIRIERIGTGRYTVDFLELGELPGGGGHVQVTAYGTSSDYCKVASWTETRVSVLCFDQSGSATDSLFNVIYLRPQANDTQYAYTWAASPTSPSYTPLSFYTHNGGSSAPVAVTRSSTGVYEVSFADFGLVGSGGGHVQVTAYGSGNSRCQVRSWGGGNATVLCFSPSGAPADSAFNVLIWRPDAGDDGVAFAWADADSSASYSPASLYAYEPNGGAITASRSGTGDYSMSFSGFEDVGVGGGHVLVTAYGISDIRCKVRNWDSSTVNVRCHDASGNPADSRYAVMFLRPPKKTWARNFAYAWGDAPTASSYDVTDRPWTFNRSGYGTTIERLGTGDYRVRFDSFDFIPGGGNVQANAYGNSGNYCNVIGWSAGYADVGCFDSSGTPADTLFSVFYLKAEDIETAAAYAWANNATAPSYTLAGAYANNPGGGAINAARTSVGTYSIEFEDFDDFGSGGGHPQVSAYGFGNDARCKTTGWTNTTVFVQCTDPAGFLVDSRYSVLFVRPDEKDFSLGFAWASEASTLAYAPPSTYAFNSADGGITASRTGTGEYTLLWFGLEEQGIDGGNVQVTSYGLSDAYCNVGFWGTGNATVNCFDASGTPTDSQFNAMFVKATPVPEPALGCLLGSGGLGLALLGVRRRSSEPKP